MKVKGLPYIMLSTKSDDPTMDLLEARFGIKGFAVMVKLLCRIYGEEGYYCLWDKEINEVFASKIKVNASLVSDVVDFLVRRGFFDLERFENAGILTSTSIQSHYIETNSRKKEVKMVESFLCANFQKNVYKNLKIVDKNGKNVCNSKTIESNEMEHNVMQSNAMEHNLTQCNVNVNVKESSVATLQETFEHDIGRKMKTTEEIKFLSFISTYGQKLTEYAMREAAIREIYNLDYIGAILSNWKEKNITAELYEEMN